VTGIDDVLDVECQRLCERYGLAPEVQALAREARSWFAIECDRVSLRDRVYPVMCCRLSSEGYTGDKTLSGWRRVRLRAGAPREARVLLDRLGGGNDIRAWLCVLAIRNLARTTPEINSLDPNKWWPAVRWVRDLEGSGGIPRRLVHVRMDAIGWACWHTPRALLAMDYERKKRATGDSTRP